MKLPPNKPYGLIPVGCPVNVRPKKWLKSFVVGPCDEIEVDSTGFDHRYLNGFDKSITGPRLEWMSKNCTRPFLVELVVATDLLAQPVKQVRMVRATFSTPVDAKAYAAAFNETKVGEEE